MDMASLDRPEYKNILLLKMADNRHGNLPVFVRTYRLQSADTGIHRHEYMQINYVMQGKARHVINHRSFDIYKGDIFVIPPYVPHMIVAEDKPGVEMFEFEFEPQFVNQNTNDIENTSSFLDFAYIEPFLVTENLVQPRLNLAGKVQIDVESLLNEVSWEYQTREPGFLLMIRSLLLRLLVITGRVFSSELQHADNRSIFDHHREAILGALRYIDEHITENLSIDETAKRFMLSPSYFSYLFKSITASTFVTYVNRLRISRAQLLLRTTDRKILDISCAVGFNNINHFNRLFRQYLGQSPGAYRKAERETNDQ